MGATHLRTGWASLVHALVEAQGPGARSRILLECVAREPWVQACGLWRRGSDPAAWSCLLRRGDDDLLHGQAFVEEVAAGRAPHDLVPGRGVLLAGQAPGALALTYAGTPESELELDLVSGLLHVARLVGAGEVEQHAPVEALVPALPQPSSAADERKLGESECQPCAELRSLHTSECGACSRARIRFDLEIEEGLESARLALSADDFGLAVRNLVSNAREALEHVPEGGCIRVTLRRAAAGMLLLAVEDTGPGLPEAVLEALRARGPEALPGPGLGLALSWSIVLGAGGALRACEPGPQGARIELQLPLYRLS
jgi:signal transduction histidine kinase